MSVTAPAPRPRWITTPARAWALAAATVWPFLYALAFMGLWFAAMFNGFRPGDDIPGWVLPVVAVHLVTMLLGFAVLAVYLVDLFRNPELAGDQNTRLVWVILIVFVGAPAMLVYWWKYLLPSTARS